MTPISITLTLPDGSSIETPVESSSGGGYLARYDDATLYLNVVRTGRTVTPAQWCAR